VQRSTQRELVERAIRSLATARSLGAPNLLTLGYRSLESASLRGGSFRLEQNLKSQYARGLECTFPNTQASFLREWAWEALLSRVGDELMLFLLTKTAMLLRLPNGCYVQLCGPLLPQLLQRRGRSLRSPLPPQPPLGGAQSGAGATAEGQAEAARRGAVFGVRSLLV